MNWSSTWYKATTLAERMAALRLDEIPPPSATTEGWQLRQWKAQTPFATGAYLSQRLALNGLTEAAFHYLLNEPTATLRQRQTMPPAWLVTFHTAFAQPFPVELPTPLQTLTNTPKCRFLVAIAPLLKWAFTELESRIGARFPTWPLIPIDSTTLFDLLAASLASRMSILNRTLTLELNLAGRQGLLVGDSPAARFESFIARLQQRDVALALFEAHPVLARQIMIRLEQWIAASLEFLVRLCTDWHAIRDTFCPDTDPGVLIAIDAEAGDAHCEGRTVRILQFQSGFRLVYKPRALAVDAHFQELLGWLNDRGAQPAFQQLKVLNRGTHGWIEFVTEQECADVDAVHRFYQRQGGYLALLYALEAIDFHSENLIAAGEHPLLIDLEALFHPFSSSGAEVYNAKNAESVLGHSVLRACLLPTSVSAGANSDGIDIGGLIDLEGQLQPRPTPTWEAQGTDEQRLVYKQQKLEGTQNCPRLGGQKIPVTAYIQPLLDGFTQIYQLLMQHRSALLDATGPLSRFATDSIRHVVRNTQTYGLLLGNSFHPDILRDGLRRERFFDQLWIDVPNRPYLARIIAAECHDLQNTDIPLFTTRPDSKDLWTSTGECIPAFLAASGLEQVRQKIARLSDHDLELQCWFIKASLAYLLEDEVDPPRVLPQSITLPSLVSPDRFLTASRAIGDRIAERALTQKTDEALWLGLRRLHQRWVPDLLDMNLYDGVSGVALFLAYLGAVTQEDRYTELAQRAWRFVRRYQQENGQYLERIGGFTGWGGSLYVLAHLNALWRDPALGADAAAILELLPPLIRHDEVLDMIGGAAGCIAGLLSLPQSHLTPQALNWAIQCGDHLLAAARPMAQGIGWLTSEEPIPLTGFAHGNAGIACALWALAEASDEPRFRTGAEAALDYERHLYSPIARNWPDLRGQQQADPTNSNYMVAWCHGASGIGLSRLQILSYAPDPLIEQELEIALQTTRDQAVGKDHSLCHGDLGRLDLLLQAAMVLGDARWRGHVHRVGGLILDDAETNGWRMGIPGKVESPGLMTGLAGIGYELLRLAVPDQVPSVLVLERPRQGSHG